MHFIRGYQLPFDSIWSILKKPKKPLTMDFATASEKAKNFSKKPSNDIFLEFYGLFKQATVGDVNVEKPGVTDLTGKAKWEAWNKVKGLSTDEAKAAYIKTYEKYAPQYA